MTEQELALLSQVKLSEKQARMLRLVAQHDTITSWDDIGYWQPPRKRHTPLPIKTLWSLFQLGFLGRIEHGRIYTTKLGQVWLDKYDTTGEDK